MTTVPSWTGNSGCRWSTLITVGDIRLARTVAGVDLLTALDGDLLWSLEADLMTLTSVMWVTCKRQAEAIGVALFEFERELSGDAIEHAATALIQGLMNFFRKSRREVLRREQTRAPTLTTLT